MERVKRKMVNYVKLIIRVTKTKTNKCHHPKQSKQQNNQNSHNNLVLKQYTYELTNTSNLLHIWHNTSIFLIETENKSEHIIRYFRKVEELLAPHRRSFFFFRAKIICKITVLSTPFGPFASFSSFAQVAAEQLLLLHQKLPSHSAEIIANFCQEIVTFGNTVLSF